MGAAGHGEQPEPFAPAAKAHPAIAVQARDLRRLAERLASGY